MGYIPLRVATIALLEGLRVLRVFSVLSGEVGAVEWYEELRAFDEEKGAKAKDEDDTSVFCKIVFSTRR